MASKKHYSKNNGVDHCYLCGRTGTLQKHHMLHGSRRKMADKYNLIVLLCPACHTALHDKGLHDRELQAQAQEIFEEQYGHKKFMEVFGKNYRR